MFTLSTTLSPRGVPALLAFALGTAFMGSACGPKYPKCEEDGDCKAGEFCVNQLCQQCRTDTDCQTGQACNAGACETIEGYCDENVGCPSGQDCVGNRCQLPQSEPLERPQQSSTGCQLQPVYFSYDSSNLEPTARQLVEFAILPEQRRTHDTIRAVKRSLS